jgi:hypothetical protein
MEQLENLADARLVLGCVYCGGGEDTREHVPSRAFLDPPYPENLPVVGACLQCNNGFSMDEEYVACLIEAVCAGTADPAALHRSKVARSLERSPALRNRIEAGRTVTSTGILFQVEVERVRRVLAKLAIGHAVYELAQEGRTDSVSVWWQPLHLLGTDQREEFDGPEVIETFGEVGSRSMQRLRVVEVALVSESGQQLRRPLILNDWVEVQPGRYRYRASDTGDLVCIRIVIGEFLAAEVTWEP